MTKPVEGQKPPGIIKTAAVLVVFHLIYLVLPLIFSIGPIYLAFFSDDANLKSIGVGWCWVYTAWLGVVRCVRGSPMPAYSRAHLSIYTKWHTTRVVVVLGTS